MSARSRWSREELQAARSRVRSALAETPAPEAFAAEAAVPPAAPRHEVPLGPAFRAAAVMSKFRIAELRGLAEDADELRQLQTQTIALRDEGWRTLAPEMRKAILRWLPRPDLDLLLERFARNDDPLQSAIRKAQTGLTPAVMRTMSVGELAALVQVYESLFLAPPFKGSLIERRLELARLLEPLRHITRTFSGRATEMQTLRDYVGVLSTGSWIGDGLRAVGDFLFKRVPKGPFLIHGPGGVGKTTLTAKFILEHALAAEQQQFPFAYLDFDRPTVNAEVPTTILIEAVRQIGLQYDSAFHASERLAVRWQERIERGADTESFVRDFIGFLETLEVREGPVLFVFDTFEEVQRRSSAYARGIMLLTGRLSIMVPRLRVVIAGRSPLDDGTYLDGQLALDAFDRESAIAYLQNSGVDAQTAELIVERTRGNPLTLTLAIELYRRDPAELRQLDAAQLTDEIIQSSLFDRILLHIPDPEVRRLAHPGLVLRRVTPEIVRDILAKPCGIDVPGLQRAEELFEKLAADSTLVTRVDPRTLVHRSDVRRLMLKPLREHQPGKVEEIHRAAIAFYRRGTDVISRAEVAYHSLSIGEPAALTPDLEPLLVNALEEFAPEAQVQLAEAYKLELPEATWRTADQKSWERATARKIIELIAIREFSGPLLLLNARNERSGHTELLIAEAQTYLAMPNLDAARRVARRGITTYRDAGSTTLLFRMLLVAAEIERLAQNFDAAYSFLADAEEIARRRNDSLMLVQVLVAHADVDWVGDRQDAEQLEDLAKATADVPDDVWARDKRLVERAVMHLALSHPHVVTRAMRLEAMDLAAEEQELAERIIEAPMAMYLTSFAARLSQRLSPANVLTDSPGVPTKNLKLKTSQREQLRDLLVKHYGGDLAGFLERRYSRGLESISFGENDIPRNAMDLVRAAEREGWLNDLIIGLWRSRFMSVDVLAFIDVIGLGPRIQVAHGMNAVPEKRLRAMLHDHRASIGALETRTCTVDIDGEQTGCGFLVDRGIATAPAALRDAAPVFTFDSVVARGRIIDQGRQVFGPLNRTNPRGSWLVSINASLADDPVDAVRSASDAPPREAVTFSRARVDPRTPLFWLWRTRQGTFLTGASQSVPQADGRYVVEVEATVEMKGAPCFDGALNIVGIHFGASPNDPKLSIIAMMRP